MTKATISTLAAASTAAFLAYFLKAASASKSKAQQTKTILLVGDIGGTNTRLALYKPGETTSLFEHTYLNSEYITEGSSTFEEKIFAPFLAASNISFADKCIVACFAVAGPVNDNCVYMTNLGQDLCLKNEDRVSIKLDGASIEASTIGDLKYVTKCKIINDFVGQGYGLLDLDLDTEVVELIPGSKARMNPTGPKACLGAGTGLGECYLTTSSFHPEEGYECYPSEGGHVDYTPRSSVEVDLMHHLKEKFDQPCRISVERVVSGKGLANIYEFVAKSFPSKIRKDIHEEFKGAEQQGRVVGVNANAKENPCPLCVQSMEIMMSAYGSEAGNCAVKFIPTGGLYVSGGLTPKNINFIAGEDSPFMKAYKDKGRLSSLVAGIPLFAVLVEDLGMRGARVCAYREFVNLNK
jgi:glucokinase